MLNDHSLSLCSLHKLIYIAVVNKFNSHDIMKIENHNDGLLDAKMKKVSKSREDRVNLG